MTRLWFAAAMAVPATAIAAAPAKTAVRSNFRINRPFIAGLLGGEIYPAKLNLG
jgi:hypothetical protein